MPEHSPSSGIGAANTRFAPEIPCTPSAPTLQSAALYGRASTVRSQLGQRIRDLRETLSLTQEKFAEKAGISVSFVSMLERGQRIPHVETLADISEALGVTLSDLFMDESGPHGRTELPLLAYLGTRRLDRKDVERLLRVARAMFDRKP